MPLILDTQLAKLIEKAADPAQFNTVPADKVIIGRTAFQTLLDNLQMARQECVDRTTWMDIATELADDLLATTTFTGYDEAPEGTALYKFHIAAGALDDSGDDEPY